MSCASNTNLCNKMTSQKPPNFRRIETLNPQGTNFLSWRHQLLSELMIHDLSKYTADPVNPPTGGDAATLAARIETHDNKIRYVSAFIMSSIHVNYTNRLMDKLKTPWDMMKEISGSCIACSRRNVSYYERQIHSLKVKDFNTIETFIEELDRLFMCIQHAGRAIADSSKISILLSALPSSFETIKTIIENRDNLTYIMAVQQIRMHIKENKSENEEISTQKALKIGFNKNTKNDFKCYICGKDGHTARYCYDNPHRKQNTRETKSDKVNKTNHKVKNQKNKVCHKCKMTEPDNSSSESENDSDDTDSSEGNDICGTISSAT